MQTGKKNRVNQTVLVLLIATAAFLAFYWNNYFSDDFEGMLGYEAKDTLTELGAYRRALDEGSSLYWDPYYLHYLPAWPQAPIYSPVTLLFLFLHKLNLFPQAKAFFVFYLIVLAAIQIFCVYTMYLFLRWCGFNFTPSVLGGLAYAYNHQTFVFGIRHGYERIAAVAIAPLFILCFFKVLEPPPSKAGYRKYAALTALLFGLSLICNGDVKPTLFFALFLAIAAFLKRPFALKNVKVLALVFVLGAVLFLLPGLLTGYAYKEVVYGYSQVENILEFSLRPAKLLLTHISTSFTDRPDYPWESTVEFSLSFMLLVVLGLFHLHRHPLRRIFLVSLIFCYVWIMGEYTFFAPVVSFINRALVMHIPTRISVLLYFCYAFLIAVGVRNLSGSKYNRVIVACLLSVPVAVLVLFFKIPASVPARYVALVFLSWLVLAGVVFRLLSKKFVWLIALFFVLERTTIFSTLEESNICDPTSYYTWDEIYRTHDRVEAIHRTPDFMEYRAFFGTKDLPDLFSHNFYLNAFTDRIRPIFAYFFLDHQLYRADRVKWIILENWSHSMWDLLNVKFFVDLDSYFLNMDEGDYSKEGLEHLQVVDEHVRINPDPEEEIFVRYRSELVPDDDSFLKGLREDSLDLKEVAYINSRDEGLIVRREGEPEAGREEISVISRKPDEITVEVKVPREALVIFSEFWFFPWEVEVDGRKAGLFRAYNILQGVKVPPGSHRVRFYFNSRHWKFVLPFICSYGLMLLLVVYIGYWHRRDVREVGDKK